MKNLQKGFAVPVIIAIVALLAIGGGYAYYKSNNVKTTPLSPVPNIENNLVGSDKDSHGCIGSAGYSWCAVKNKCLRTWEEKCEANPAVIKDNNVTSNTNTPPVNDQTKNLLTYKNNKYGFQFKYSKEWTLIEKSGELESYNISLYKNYRSAATTAYPNDGMKYDGMISMNISNPSLSGQGPMGERPDIISSEQVNINGQSATRKITSFTSTGKDLSYTMNLKYNSNLLISISVYAYQGDNGNNYSTYNNTLDELMKTFTWFTPTVVIDVPPPLGNSTLKISCNSEGCNTSGVNSTRSDFYVTVDGTKVKVLIDGETRLRYVHGIDSETPGTIEDIVKWINFYPMINGPVLGMPFSATIYGDWIDGNTFKANWIKWSIG